MLEINDPDENCANILKTCSNTVMNNTTVL